MNRRRYTVQSHQAYVSSRRQESRPRRRLKNLLKSHLDIWCKNDAENTGKSLTPELMSQ